MAEFPDSDKRAVIIEGEGADESGMPNLERWMMRKADTQVDYWEGED